MAGVDIRTTQDLGGWHEIEMIKRYAHLSQEHKQSAVEKIAAGDSTTLFIEY